MDLTDPTGATLETVQQIGYTETGLLETIHSLLASEKALTINKL
ncbi:MAG: hypothetical protein R2688_06255 [Fimbriimonadaceae bacterium]